MLSLDLEDLLRILPHRPPLLMLDRVISLIPGEHAVGLKQVCGDEAGLDHHRHGFVFPSTFAVEGLAQLAQILAAEISVPEDRNLRTPWPELLGVESLTVHRELLAPDTLHLSVSKLDRAPIQLEEGEASDRGGTRVRFAGEATVDAGVFLEVRFSLRLPGGVAT